MAIMDDETYLRVVGHWPSWRSFTFRCPQCKADVRPANAKCIVCQNCGEAGNLEHFSSVERMAA
jgi:hypothetical protein